MDEEPAAVSPLHRLHGPDEATDRTATADDHPTDALERSPDPAICPFLHGIEGTDGLGRPIESPDAANRCTALHDAVPQSLRQQELVCLTSGHVNCPRYLRGTQQLPSSVLSERVHSSPAMTKATAGALAVLVLAFLASIGFVVANGGLVLTAAVSAPTPAGAVLGEIETAAPSAAPTTLPTASATLGPTPTPPATPLATPAPTAMPQPTPRATPKQTSARFALLKPCPGTPNCYIYRVRSGDNLFSIARYFGVSQKTVEAMNPWINNGLVVGRDLRIPTPTR